MKQICKTNQSTVYVDKERVIKVPDNPIREAIIWKLLANHKHPYLLSTAISSSQFPLAFVSPLYACSLDKIIKTHDSWRKLWIQIGSALGFLASMGILHRDVKPANIFCTTNSLDTTDFVLGDLGSAVLIRSEGLMYTDEVTTPEYTAPDEVTGYDRDAWALGVILRKMGANIADIECPSWPANRMIRTKSVGIPADLIDNLFDKMGSFEQSDLVKAYVEKMNKFVNAKTTILLKIALEFYTMMTITDEDVKKLGEPFTQAELLKVLIAIPPP